MLCDQLAAVTLDEVEDMFRDHPDERERKIAARWSFEAFERLKPGIRQAHKFILDDDVSHSCESVRSGRPSSIRAALEYAAFPFEVTWFEWTGSIVSDYRKLKPGTTIPIRVGMLCTVDETFRAGEVHLFWSLRRNGIYQLRVAMTSALVDFGGKWIPELRAKHGLGSEGPKVRPTMQELRHLLPNKAKWIDDEREVDAILQANDEAILIPSAKVFGEDEAGLRHVQSIGWQHIVDATHSDWEGEIGFLEAVLIMLNAKNGVDRREAIPTERQNRARAKIGKPPLFEHHTVHLKLRGPERRPAGDGSHASPRAHIVRGHFKVRKTGVYFWSPFVRGDAKAGTVRSRYEVHA